MATGWASPITVYRKDDGSNFLRGGGQIVVLFEFDLGTVNLDGHRVAFEGR